MPISASHMNGVHRSRLPVPQSSTSSNSPSNLKRTNDELRQHVSRLKAELDVERAKSRQIHRDKVADIKKLKDEYDKEKFIVQGSVVDKMKGEHEFEMKKLRETLQKEKEIEIKQILRFKDEELRTTKKMMAEDKEFSLKEQDDRLKRELGSKAKDGNNETENKLRQELNECRRQKVHIEEALKQKSASEAEKSDIIRKLKEEHEKENQRVIRDARIQIARNVQELKNAQKALNEKEQEISKRELDLTRLEELKDQLSEKIRSEHIENGVTKTDKELQLRNAELKRNLDEVSKKLSLIEKESLLKRTDMKDVESSPRSDSRVKELKKRNGELVNLAKKLEEKAKRLQEELRDLKSKEPGVKTSSSDAVESFKKSFTMQRARDLAENAKNLMAKDKEITQLKGKIATLEEQLRQKVEDVSETEKLETIIHQIEKEKLKLEKQLSVKMSYEEKQQSAKRKEENVLRDELESIKIEKEQLEELVDVQRTKAKKHKIEIEDLKERGKQCDHLLEILKERNEECDALTKDLQLKGAELLELKELLEVSEKKRKNLETEVEKHKLMATNLQDKLNEQSQKIVDLEDLQNEYEVLKQRLSNAENQCHVMQDQVEDFQEKIASYKKIEQQLKDQEEKCKVWERDYDYAVEQINKRNKEITELHETQRNMKENYEDEIGSLRAEISRLEDICVDLESKESDYKMMLEAKKGISESRKSTNHVYVQTSRPQTPVKSDDRLVTEDFAPDVETAFVTEAGLEEFDDFIIPTNTKQNKPPLESEPDNSLKCEDDILDVASSRIAALAAMSSSEGDFSREDQPIDVHFSDDDELNGFDNYGVKQKPDRSKNKMVTQNGLADTGDTSDELSLSLDEFSDGEEEEVLPHDNEMPKGTAKTRGKERTASKKRLNFQEKQSSDSSVFGPITPQASVDSLADNDAQGVNSNVENDLSENKVEKLSVFIAKYTYDPLQHSPNEDPSLELALEAGDYVYIFGDADEDGFYTGELANGHRGLVPSNFVEKITDEGQLFPIANGHEAYPGDESDEDLTEAEYLKMTPRPMSVPVVGDIFKGETSGESEDEFFKKKGLPPPRKLKLERQLNNSIVISWLAPENVGEDEIRGYSIKADGQLKETVIGSDKTKAIVSDVARDKVHRITVHCFDKNEKESPGSVAAITVGRGASAIPTDLRVSNSSATTADLEWACGNSSMMHAVYLDGKEIHVLKPGVDRFKLTSLIPDHEYEVSVEARATVDQRKIKKVGTVMSNGLIFRTTKGAPPEPPLNVHARVIRKSASHEATSVNVSWLPVTITETDAAKSPIVKGYMIYMNDHEALFIDQPTVDHAKIQAKDLAAILKDSKVEYIELWVKTVSIFGESAVSNVVILPVDKFLYKEIYNKERAKAPEPNKKVPKALGATDTVAEKQKADVSKTGQKIDDVNAEVKVKPTVIRYDVVDSEDSDSEEDDSDEEAPPDFHSSKEIDSTKPMDDQLEPAPPVPTTEIPSKSVDGNPPDNLILPSIPMPDYPSANSKKDEQDTVTIPEADYPDAVEVKPRKHFALEELLSSSDSELSAIEEETVEELLEYDKDGSPINGTQRTYSLSKGEGGHASPANKTFSFHSEEEKNETYDVEEKNGKASEKFSEKKSTFTSKDTLTFDSDDVVDILEKDIVEGVPELPLDLEKDDIDKAESKQNDRKYKENKGLATVASIPVTDLSDLSNDVENIKPEGAKAINIKVGPILSENVNANSMHVQPNVCDKDDDLPAKETPAQTNDHENINTLPVRRKWVQNNSDPSSNIEFAKGDNSLEIASADHGSLDDSRQLALEDKIVADEQENNVRNGFDLSASQVGIQNQSSPLHQNKDIDILEGKKESTYRNSTPTGGSTQANEVSVEVEEPKSMGQVVSEGENAEDDELDIDNFDDEPIKIPSTSVHDLYTLNAVDSFDESILDSETEYKPDFIPTGVESIPNTEHENNGTEKRSEEPAGSFTEEPAMNNNVFSGVPIDKSIHKAEPVSSSQDDKLKDNNVNGIDEVSGEDTRTNHVEDKTIVKNVRVFVALFSYDPITMSPNTDGVDEELPFTEGDLIKVFGDCDEDGFYYGELHEKRGFVPSNMVQEVSLGDFGNSFHIPPPPSADITGDSEDQISEEREHRRQSQSHSATVNQDKTDTSDNKGARKESGGTSEGKLTKESGQEAKQEDTKMEDIFARIENIELEEKEKDYRYISERDSIYCLPPRRMIALYDYDPAVSSPNVDSEVELPFNKGDILLVFGDMDEDGFFAAQSSGERGLVPSNFLENCPVPSDSEEFEINMGATSPSFQVFYFILII
eukprot:gene15196-6393_t